MPELTVTAFKWTGNYYNAEYDTSYQVTFNDDDDTYDGGADASETVSIDGGADLATWSQPYSIDVSFTDTAGDPHVETFYFFYAGNEWYFVPGPDSEFTEGATLGTYQDHTVGWEYKEMVCFVDGTRVLTEAGHRNVEELVPGDKIWTGSGIFKPLKLNLQRKLSPLDLWANPKLAPVRIEAGALGAGVPHRALWVSRQHRMLVASSIAQRMFGAPEVLISAIRLTALPGIAIDTQRSQFSYHHLVFSEHEIVCANGAMSESFFPGSVALDAVPEAALEEFEMLFPKVRMTGEDPRPAAPIPCNRKQKRLVHRHLKNKKPLVQACQGSKFVTRPKAETQSV